MRTITIGLLLLALGAAPAAQAGFWDDVKQGAKNVGDGLSEGARKLTGKGSESSDRDDSDGDDEEAKEGGNGVKDRVNSGMRNLWN